MKCNYFRPRGRGLSSNAGTQRVKLAAVPENKPGSRGPRRKEKKNERKNAASPASSSDGDRWTNCSAVFESLYSICFLFCFFYVFFFFLRPAVDASPYVYDHAECMAAKREKKKKRANETEITAQ